MTAYDELKEKIENKKFEFPEDAIDAIVKNYKSGLITKEQRAELLRMA